MWIAVFLEKGQPRFLCGINIIFDNTINNFSFLKTYFHSFAVSYSAPHVPTNF